jgi:hypothetical protein
MSECKCDCTEGEFVVKLQSLAQGKYLQGEEEPKFRLL